MARKHRSQSSSSSDDSSEVSKSRSRSSSVKKSKKQKSSKSHKSRDGGKKSHRSHSRKHDRHRKKKSKRSYSSESDSSSRSSEDDSRKRKKRRSRSSHKRRRSKSSRNDRHRRSSSRENKRGKSPKREESKKSLKPSNTQDSSKSLVIEHAAPQQQMSAEDIERENERKKQLRLQKLRNLELLEKEQEAAANDTSKSLQAQNNSAKANDKSSSTQQFPASMPALPKFPDLPKEIQEQNNKTKGGNDGEQSLENDKNSGNDNKFSKYATAYGLVDELEIGDDEQADENKEQDNQEIKPEEEEEEEIDPLDAYMNEINSTAKKEVEKSISQDKTGYFSQSLKPQQDKQPQVITFEELSKFSMPQPKPQNITIQNGGYQGGQLNDENNNSNVKSNMNDEQDDDQDDESYRQAFLEALKKQEEQKKVKFDDLIEKKEDKKKIVDKEIMDDDMSDEYIPYEEDLDQGEFMARQKREQDRKNFKNLKQNEDYEFQPFRKNFYIEPKDLAEMTPEEVEAYRKDLGDIIVRGKDCPKPIKQWYQCGLSDRILKVLTERRKFDAPFPIQCQSIPCIMSGRDVIGIAETGSGKTLSYLLPLFRHIKDQPPLEEGDGPIGIIMAPTRELAWQIHLECRHFSKATGLRSTCVQGGASMKEQINDLKSGCEIVVCTPGRMIDVLTQAGGRITNVRRTTFIVIDEADRMFDYGFEPQITKILAQVRKDKQLVMFSATFPKNVENLAKKILNKPIEIIVGSRGKVNPNITQIVEVRREDTKFLRLLELLGQWNEKGSILIFVDKQTEADNLFKELLKYGYFPLVIHGGQDPVDRDFTIVDFKKGIRTIMVATSVCARGLDIKAIKLVVNYQCPNHKEDYIHRIGRTGRAGQKGTAVTFITPEEENYSEDLLEALEMSEIEPPKDLKDLVYQYREKIKKGEAKRYTNTNLSGAGYKFDDSEKSKVKETKKAMKRQLGVELNIDEAESDDDEIINKKEEKDKEADKELTQKDYQKLIRDPATKQAMMQAATKAATKALEEGKSSEEVVLAAKQSMQSLLSDYKGTAIERAVELRDAFESKEDENGEFVSADLEINDYPQTARNKVLNKDYLLQIEDLNNVKISQRGTLFEGKQKIPIGQKKLTLHITGESKHLVAEAYRDIRKVLEDEASRVARTLGGSNKFTLTNI